MVPLKALCLLLQVPGKKEAAVPQKEGEKTRYRVDQERKLQIEAAIVRIMKSKNRLHHRALVTEASPPGDLSMID